MNRIKKHEELHVPLRETCRYLVVLYQLICEVHASYRFVVSLDDCSAINCYVSACSPGPLGQLPYGKMQAGQLHSLASVPRPRPLNFLLGNHRTVFLSFAALFRVSKDSFTFCWLESCRSRRFLFFSKL